LFARISSPLASLGYPVLEYSGNNKKTICHWVQGEGEEGQASLDVITLVNSSWKVDDPYLLYGTLNRMEISKEGFRTVLWSRSWSWCWCWYTEVSAPAPDQTKVVYLIIIRI
jgi:hypothetical protein